MQARAHPNLQLVLEVVLRTPRTHRERVYCHMFCNRCHFLRLYIALAWPLALPFLRSITWRWSRAVERDPTLCVRFPLRGLPDPEGRAGMGCE